jgi:hypothetical protein
MSVVHDTRSGSYHHQRKIRLRIASKSTRKWGSYQWKGIRAAATHYLRRKSGSLRALRRLAREKELACIMEGGNFRGAYSANENMILGVRCIFSLGWQDEHAFCDRTSKIGSFNWNNANYSFCLIYIVEFELRFRCRTWFLFGVNCIICGNGNSVITQGILVLINVLFDRFAQVNLWESRYLCDGFYCAMTSRLSARTWRMGVLHQCFTFIVVHR